MAFLTVQMTFALNLVTFHFIQQATLSYFFLYWRKMMNSFSSKFYAGTIFRLPLESETVIRALLESLISLVGITVFIMDY